MERITAKRLIGIRTLHEQDSKVPRWHQEHADRAHDHRAELLDFLEAERRYVETLEGKP